MALTALEVDSAKPKPVRYEVPDGNGLYLIVQPSGVKSWAVRYRVAGVPRKLTLGRVSEALTLKEARRRAAAEIGKVANGADPAKNKTQARVAVKAAAADAERDLVEKVVVRFNDWYPTKVKKRTKAKVRASTVAEVKRILLRDVMPVWEGRSIRSITRKDVEKILQGIMARGAPVMANRVLACLRLMFNWCLGEEIISKSPVAGIEPPGEEHCRVRVLIAEPDDDGGFEVGDDDDEAGASSDRDDAGNDRELRLIWQAAETIGQPFGPIVKLLILTGQRKNEVGGMRWSELDLARRRWVLPPERVKNGREHVVPLSILAVSILEAQPRIANSEGAGSDFVFTTTGEGPVSGFGRAKRQLDKAIAAAIAEEGPDASPMQDWTLHDLRRTTVTGLQRLGVAVIVTERILNHVSGQLRGVAAIYQRHPYGKEKRIALDSWAGFVERLVAPLPAGTASNVIEMLRARP